MLGLLQLLVSLGTLGCGLPSPVQGYVTPATLNDSYPANVVDPPWNSSSVNIPRHTAQAVVRFVATSTREMVDVLATANATSSNPDYYFSVFQDGAFLSSFQSAASTFTPQRFVISGLTPGSTIDIVEPTQSGAGNPPPPAGPLQGGYVQRLYYSTPIKATVARKTVIFGNSFSGAFGASVPWNAHGIVGGLRAIHPSGVVGVATRQYSGDGYLVFTDSTHETAAQVAADLVSLCDGTVSNEIVFLAQDRNDWFFASGTPTAVAAQCAAICDAVHALNPTIKILVTTVWPTLEEATTNSLGYITNDYRMATLGVSSGRSSYVTTLNFAAGGVLPTWNTATDLMPSDNSHPDDTGYAKILTATRAVLPCGAI